MKRFNMIDEEFICENCHQKVNKLNYTPCSLGIYKSSNNPFFRISSLFIKIPPTISLVYLTSFIVIIIIPTSVLVNSFLIKLSRLPKVKRQHPLKCCLLTS